MKIDTFSSTTTSLEKVNLSHEDYQGLVSITHKQTILQRNIEKVTHIDEKVIELVLKSEITKIEPSAGFLVEVYASGSDGKLHRLFQNDVVDLYGNVIERGFADFIMIEIDV